MDTQGIVHKYDDNVDTDAIIPARYLNTLLHQELAQHCMVNIDTDFANRVRPGDIIVANKNLGCGSSREHTPIAIGANGVSCVIASTFVRIFYRNSTSTGLPILECEGAAREIRAGDEVSMDSDTGVIRDPTTGRTYQAQPFPLFIQNIISKGGLLDSIANP